LQLCPSAGADLDAEVTALKARLELDATPVSARSFRGAAAVGPKPLARIRVARVARADATAPEPIDLGGGVYEMPWLTAAA
jgi:hypothetical protein